MPEPEKPVFLVDVRSDPVAVKIAGRACFQNSACLSEFFSEMIKSGRRRFVLDFEGCASMDSTFLGVLAGTALELRRLDPPGSVVLCRIGARNLELVRNLGLHRIMTVDSECALTQESGIKPDPQLHRIMTVDSEGACSSPESATEALEAGNRGAEVENARLVLRAHEALIAVDPKNREKFQDVLEFLKGKVNGG